MRTVLDVVQNFYYLDSMRFRTHFNRTRKQIFFNPIGRVKIKKNTMCITIMFSRPNRTMFITVSDNNVYYYLKAKLLHKLHG